MNYFKTLFFLFLAISFLGIFYFRVVFTPTIITPNSSYHQFESKLRLSLLANHLNFQQLIIDPKTGQCQLEITDPSTQHHFIVTLSITQDPYLQISVLQQLIKVAKIRHQVVTHINLGALHPYATLQDS